MNTGEPNVFGLMLTPTVSALVAPPPIEIPEWPPELLSPAGAILLLGIGTGLVLADIKPGSPPRRPHQDEKGRELPDNKRVVKVKDAVDAVEETLFSGGPVMA